MTWEQTYILNNYALYGEDVVSLRTGNIIRGGHSQLGYRTVTVNYAPKKQFSFPFHRLKFLLAHGYLPVIVDHANGDTTDNRLSNLRAADFRLNMANRRKNSSKYSASFKGVYRHRAKFIAKIGSSYIGVFEDEMVAACAYDLCALHLFGEYAALNFP